MKFIVKHHHNHAEKMKDFDHFSVDVHPEHEGTRCFFVVKKDGSKEDFSMAKCVQRMAEEA